MKNRPLALGAHLSIAGGLDLALDRARELGCDTVQIFTKNNRTWKESLPEADRIDCFLRKRQSLGIKTVISHAAYLVNIAAPYSGKADKGKRKRAVQALAAELHRCRLLGIDHLVLHPGAHLGAGEKTGIHLAAQAVIQAFELARDAKPAAADQPDALPGPRLLLETTSGQGTCLGHRFKQIAALLDTIRMPDRTGVCLDTCHIFAAGYDLSSAAAVDETLARFDRVIGLNRLFALHLNDSKTDLNARRDRHEHIGLGRIGEAGFRRILSHPSLAGLPMILETPKTRDGREMDPVNLSKLLALAN